MMGKYNKTAGAIVFNTYQLYRTVSLANLEVSLLEAERKARPCERARIRENMLFPACRETRICAGNTTR